MKIERKKEFKKVKIEHNKRLLWIIGVLIVILAIIVISLRQEITKRDNSNTQIANPASVYCIENGGKLEIKENSEGQYGLCTLPSGLVCEEWAFFRGECNLSLPLNTRDSCLQDADCVAASCCHPRSCINKDFAPDCSGVKCTMSCELGTLDCGYASCVCENSKCSVRLNS
ncbi:DUF333 domain-containing protein [Candidatus Pacearchaeota archaeon]|nr:DUF333 domain-containing protein [Candidatus Pacearchaeota archaeon]